MYRVPITPRIQQIIKKRMGGVDPATLSVYEVLTNTTKPIEKAGGLYRGASMKQTYLTKLASFAQTEKYIPLLLLHNEHGSLPQGLVLDADVYPDNSGNFELRSLIVLNRNDQADSLDDRVSKGIVNRVSSNTKPQDLYCSSCDFHYTKDDDSREYLNLSSWTKEPKCPNGHEVGKNGVHLKLDNPEYWGELSLVTQGAVTDARILKESELKLAQKSDITQLAASSDTDRLILVTHDHTSNTNVIPNIDLGAADPTNPTGDPSMSISLTHEQYQTLSEKAAKAAVLEAQNTALQAQLAAANTEKDTAVQAKDALEAEKATLAADKTALETEKATLTAEKTELTTKLAAAGVPDGGASKPPADGAAASTVPAIGLGAASFAATLPTV